MRYGALISAVCHAGLVSFVMLSTPRQFVASERSIEAELVRADEIDRPKEQPQEQPKEQPKPEKPIPTPGWSAINRSRSGSRPSSPVHRVSTAKHA